METILKVSNLSVSLSNGTKILKDVSFDVNSGEVVAIVGGNGAGKSTILKAIMRVEEGKNISGTISYCGGANVLDMEETELQSFRSKVAYVSQKDDYVNYGKNVTVSDIIILSAEPYFANGYTEKDVGLLLDKYQLRVYEETKEGKKGKPLFYEKSCPAKLSGGQQRMLSIISAVAVREDAKLFIIDEPLNNLDFKNARKISNLITKIHKENPNAAILMVTHCRIFPAVTRIITIDNGIVVPNEEEYKCHSCFGKANDEGYYEF